MDWSIGLSDGICRAIEGHQRVSSQVRGGHVREKPELAQIRYNYSTLGHWAIAIALQKVDSWLH